MQKEAVKQRIRFLVEHGGLHEIDPEARWRWAVVALLAVIAIEEGLRLVIAVLR